jgi:hypothetical protein
VKIDELRAAIGAAGGEGNALEHADALLGKINRLEATGRYRELLDQLTRAREAGDFRGRVLEVNYAEQFERNGHQLHYGAKQEGRRGDIDTLWNVSGREVFTELKLLGQDRATRLDIDTQIRQGGVGESVITDDTRDIARMQRDLMGKASIRKFNPTLEAKRINLVGVDVAELQLGAVDPGDCFLAAGGNPLAVQFYAPEMVLRPGVVGVFESLEGTVLTAAQREWLSTFQCLPPGEPHPREYIHGALFLFRMPKETAALSYDLSAILVWNSRVVGRETALAVQDALYRIIPRHRLYPDDA